MLFRLLLPLITLIPISGDAVARSNAREPTRGPLAYMRVYGLADPPRGFVQFCLKTPNECRSGKANDNRIEATPAKVAELDEVNRSVNKAIKPITDRELYGVDELWTIPTTQGDCEDYVLLKRRILMSRRWPSSALLITVVLDENKQGHAILTARTDAGDLILDNKHDDLKLWHQTPYTFIMRQSYLNPMVWIALSPTDADSPTVAAGARHSTQPAAVQQQPAAPSTR